MSARLLATALLLTAASARSQTAETSASPAGDAVPAPVPDPSLERLKARLREMTRPHSAEELAAGIDWKQIERERQQRDLQPRPDTRPPAGPIFHPPGESDPSLHVRTDDIDVAFSRPSSRVELGLGYNSLEFWQGTQPIEQDKGAHAFLRIDLSRRRGPAPETGAVVWPVVHRTQTEQSGIFPPRLQMDDIAVPNPPWNFPLPNLGSLSTPKPSVVPALGAPNGR